MKCISCEHEHNENFCPNCGEKSGIERITFFSILGSTFSIITNMDKGLLFNFKAMFLKPKKITTDYINGKRKGILNPVTYLIVAISLYLIVITIFQIPHEPENIKSTSKPEKLYFAVEAGRFIRKYLKYFWIFSILPLGLSLKIVFGKYNYPEHLAISSFIIAQATMVGIFSYLLFKTFIVKDPLVLSTMFFLIFKIFKTDNDIIGSLLTTLTALLLFLFQLFLIMIAISILKI